MQDLGLWFSRTHRFIFQGRCCSVCVCVFFEVGLCGNYNGFHDVNSQSPHVDLLPTSLRISLFGNDPTSMGRGLSKIVLGVASRSCRHRFQLRAELGYCFDVPR